MREETNKLLDKLKEEKLIINYMYHLDADGYEIRMDRTHYLGLPSSLFTKFPEIAEKTIRRQADALKDIDNNSK